MSKDAFDLLHETVSDLNKSYINLVKTVSVQGVWIQIFKFLFMSVIGGLTTLWIKSI